MKHISNEDKASQLANYFAGETDYKESAAYSAALEAMKWKEQQWIEKLEDWLANNICNAYNFRGNDISATFINDCIKAMKGE